MNNEKTKAILRSVQAINTMADLVLIEYQNYLADKPFKLPILNQKAKRIKEDALGIKKELNRLAKVKDAEETEDHALQMTRLVKFFSTMRVQQLEEYMDKLEMIPTVDVNDTIKTLDDEKQD